MTIEELAEKNRVRTAKDDCGDVVITAKLGNMFMHSDKIVGAMFIPDNVNKGWTARRKEWLKAGATVIQNGDNEGTVIFPADRKDLIKMSFKLLKVYRKRIVTPEAKAKLTERLAKARILKRKRT